MLKFRNFIRSPLKTCFGTISNQNTDKLSCLLDSIKTAQLWYITVNTDERDRNLNNEIKGIETAKINYKEVAPTSKKSDNTKVKYEDLIDANDSTEYEKNY